MRQTLSRLARSVLESLVDSDRPRVGCDGFGVADRAELFGLHVKLGASRDEIRAAIDELWECRLLRLRLLPSIPGIRPTGWLEVSP